jgi:endonuclease/exonuclease/phosphatase family metal-dependent hydrolase
MASEFTADEWDKINQTLAANPQRYGVPRRVYGSVVLASFNIRKLGKRSQRSANTWRFLAYLCKHFDLLAIQEIMDDLEGFDYLRELMGAEFHALVSDRTGAFPGEAGMGERLGFIYNPNLVQRGNVVSDISFDRSKLIKTVVDNYDVLRQELLPYLRYMDAHAAWTKMPDGPEPKPPKVQIPVFLTFIRQPFCASFRLVGHPGTRPYDLMAINAHLYFGNSVADRRQEFDALMAWILGRLKESIDNGDVNFVLLGDLNLDFDNPKTDRERITRHIQSIDADRTTTGHRAHIYFPFLDPHPTQSEPFRTNARLSETFDQIGLFCYDSRWPTRPTTMGEQPQGPDYGMVNFVQLFSEALYGQPLEALSRDERRALYAKFEYEVSDHMPIWLRVPLPDD